MRSHSTSSPRFCARRASPERTASERGSISSARRWRSSARASSPKSRSASSATRSRSAPATPVSAFLRRRSTRASSRSASTSAFPAARASSPSGGRRGGTPRAGGGARLFGDLGELAQDAQVRRVHRRRELELLERERDVALGPSDLAQALVEGRALAVLAPAGLLDESQQLGARLVATAALGAPVGAGAAQTFVARQEPHGALEHGNGAREQPEARIGLGRLARARDDQGLVVGVVAALGQH